MSTVASMLNFVVCRRCWPASLYVVIMVAFLQQKLVHGAELVETEGCPLWLANSTIPGAGRGVFAGQRFDKDVVLAVSRKLQAPHSFTEVTQLKDYVFEVASEDTGTTVSQLMTGVVSMINHAEERFSNVKLVVAGSEEGRANLQVLRPIYKGEELFISYGSRDWFAVRNLVYNVPGAKKESLDDLQQVGTCLPEVGPEPSGEGIIALRPMATDETLTSPMFIYPRTVLDSGSAASVSLGHPQADVAVLPFLLPGRLQSGEGEPNVAYSLTAADSAALAQNAVALCDSAEPQLALHLKVLRPIAAGELLKIDYNAASQHHSPTLPIPSRDGFFPPAWAENVIEARVLAAEQGVPQAQYWLAQYLRFGHSLPDKSEKHMRWIDDQPSKAREWYRLAAEQGNVLACVRLGLVYKTGDGVVADETESAAWYKKAAEAGNGVAQSALGLAYLKGLGVSQDASEAMQWLEKAAENGITQAMHNLGLAYQRGAGGAKDSKASATWFRRAADQGHIKAQYSMALAYGKGDGVAQSMPQAMKFFRKAAEQGHAEAQYNYALALEHGSFVKQNETEAQIWYHKAAAQGIHKPEPKQDDTAQVEAGDDGRKWEEAKTEL